MKTLFIFIILGISFNALADATSEGVWMMKNCNWNDVSKERIENQTNLEALGFIKSNLHNCSHIRMQSSKKNNEAVAVKAYECYVDMVKDTSLSDIMYDRSKEFKTGEDLDDGILKIAKEATDKKCPLSGDVEVDHLAELYIAEIIKLAEMRKPFAEAEAKKQEKDFAEQKTKEDQAEKISNSPACLKISKFYEYCEIKKNRDTTKLAYEKEKVLNNRSGTVNLANIRGYTRALISLDDQLNKASSEFSKIKSPGFDLNNCTLKKIDDENGLRYVLNDKTISLIKSYKSKSCQNNNWEPDGY